MKTAICVPGDTFEKVARRAEQLGMSRSEFFSRAAARYLDELDAESITEQLNAALDAQRAPDDSAGCGGRRSPGTRRRFGRLVVERGDIHWVDPVEPIRSRPARRRPVLIGSSDTYNRSKLATIAVVVITSSTELAARPGNVFLLRRSPGCRRTRSRTSRRS